jgi:hypothetical protein
MKNSSPKTYAGTIREGINRITAKLLCQANSANLTKFYSINVTGMNGIVPKQSAMTRSNTSVAPLSSNSSSSLFYQTPLINQLSLPKNSNSSASTGSSGSLHHSFYGKDHHNGMSSHHYHSFYGKGHPNSMGRSKHNGGYCTYSEYKSNVCG